MRTRIQVTERATYIVEVDVDDPMDLDQIEQAWVNLPASTADAGLVDYDDRTIEVLPQDDVPANFQLDSLIATLRQDYNRLTEEIAHLESIGRHAAAECIANEAHGVGRSLAAAVQIRSAYEGGERDDEA